MGSLSSRLSSYLLLIISHDANWREDYNKPGCALFETHNGRVLVPVPLYYGSLNLAFNLLLLSEHPGLTGFYKKNVT